jgi:hypothetical protein
MRNRACSTVNWVTCCVFISFCGAGLVTCRFVTESRERGDRWSIKEGGETEGNGDSLETAPGEVRERGADLSSRSEVASGITAQRRRRIAAAGDESRTVRITAAKMTRGEWVGGLNHRCFCRNSNFGGTRGSFTERQRELHAASSVAAELTPFSSRSLSFFFLLFCYPLRSSPGSLAPRGAGGAAGSGKRASPCAEPPRIEGHGWAPSPARGSAASLEEGEGARSLRVRSYQR